MSKPCIFLDRDGVLIKDFPHRAVYEQDAVYDFTLPSLKRAYDAGYYLVIVTNQSGIARGITTVEQVEEVNRQLVEYIESGGAKIDAVYYSPHHPDFTHDSDCRKPKPGMLLKAGEVLDIDYAKSWMIGDCTSDIAAGQAAGTKAILVETGFGGSDGKADATPDFKVANLEAAIDLILSQS